MMRWASLWVGIAFLAGVGVLSACSGGATTGANGGGSASTGGPSGTGGGSRTTASTTASNSTTGQSVSSGSSSGSSTASGSTTSGTGGGSAAIDYGIWMLQLPSGSGTSPDTIASARLAMGYSDAYFYPAPDGGQIFMDPATGITTSGSLHSRTEMREMAPDGSNAAWAASGTNTLTVSGKVLMVGGGTSGKVTIGQVFNGTDSIPLCELEYVTSKGGFEVLYEEAKGAGTVVDLKTPVGLGTKYTYTLSLSASTLTVSINGALVYTYTPSAATLTKQFYFKFGNYDQTATAGAVSTVPYTTVEVFSAEVVHN